MLSYKKRDNMLSLEGRSVTKLSIKCTKQKYFQLLLSLLLLLLLFKVNVKLFSIICLIDILQGPSSNILNGLPTVKYSEPSKNERSHPYIKASSYHPTALNLKPKQVPNANQYFVVLHSLLHLPPLSRAMFSHFDSTVLLSAVP